MKITRNIERTMMVTAEELYAALADKHDLPKADEVRFDCDVCYSGAVTLIARTSVEEDL